MALKTIFSIMRPSFIVDAHKKVLTGFLACWMAIIAMGFASVLQADDHKVRSISLLSSGTYTAATSYSTAFDVSAYSEAQIFINVTTRTDASTLDVTVQVSPDNTVWYTHTAIAQITATGQYRTAITNFGNYVRIKYVVGVTSFAFSVVGVFKN